MRVLQRAVATAVASLAFATAGVVAAAPASATPEDGKGCVGTPAIPASYVCVISLTPEVLVPELTTTTVPVTVPSVCYFLDCTQPTTVNVPVPGVTPRSGVVAVLWYQGTYYPIGVGTIDDVWKVLVDTLDFVNGVVRNLDEGTVTPLAEYAVAQANYYRDVVEQEAGAAVQQVLDIVRGLPTLDEIVDAITRYLQEQVYPIVQSLYDWARETVDQAADEARERLAQLVEDVEYCLRVCFSTDGIDDPRKYIST